jgi:hypothetical protein
MSTGVPYTFTTAASTNLQPIRAGQTGNIKGWVVTNTAAYAIYMKFYWQPANVTTLPVVGTTVPAITVTCPAPTATTGVGGGTVNNFQEGITNNGELWVWVTKNAVSTDTTATAAGDGIITILVE